MLGDHNLMYRMDMRVPGPSPPVLFGRRPLKALFQSGAFSMPSELRKIEKKRFLLVVESQDLVSAGSYPPDCGVLL